MPMWICWVEGQRTLHFGFHLQHWIGQKVPRGPHSPSKAMFHWWKSPWVTTRTDASCPTALSIKDVMWGSRSWRIASSSALQTLLTSFPIPLLLLAPPSSSKTFCTAVNTARVSCVSESKLTQFLVHKPSFLQQNSCWLHLCSWERKVSLEEGEIRPRYPWTSKSTLWSWQNGTT